jgi:glyoxylase-like metal-dependent hydrolase (beta-lactamase superfamily II)
MFTSNPLPENVATAKLPHLVLTDIFAFAPNRDTLGGTAYFIVNKAGNILVDAPAWHSVNHDFMTNHGGVKWLVVTHRGGLGQTATIAKHVGCEIIIQEQEAYLLPDTPVTTYHQELAFTDNCQLIWTPGHSPGSACLYYQAQGGVLFTGRHLLPDQHRNPVPLKSAKTFHWPRQQRHVARLKEQFPIERLHYILPGASSGLLRGQGYIDVHQQSW